MLLYNSLALFLSLSSSRRTYASASAVASDHHIALDLPPPNRILQAKQATTTTAVPSPTPERCTIRSPHSGAFFDLKPLHISPLGSTPDKSPRPAHGHRAISRSNSWNTTGWDLGYNFTMNFCGGVVEDLDLIGGVVGIERENYVNVSAYYRKDGKVYSIGQENQTPVIRGRKLVLNYTNGSPCDSPYDRRNNPSISRSAEAGVGWTYGEDADGTASTTDGDDEDETTRELIGGHDSPKSNTTDPHVRRKSTIISLICEKDPLMPQLVLSFVAASQDQCTYFFEARSPAACAGIEIAKQTLSPSGVFGVIVLIAVLVYVVGGCVYSRVVLQQRGWRQLPNYGLWAGILGFGRDVFIILFSTCTRCLPFARRSRGYGNSGNSINGSNGHGSYSRMSGNGLNGGLNGSINGSAGGYLSRNGGMGGAGAGGGRRETDAENRLIDDLNEEWED